MQRHWLRHLYRSNLKHGMVSALRSSHGDVSEEATLLVQLISSRSKTLIPCQIVFTPTMYLSRAPGQVLKYTRSCPKKWSDTKKTTSYREVRPESL